MDVGQGRLGQAMFPGWSSLEWILRKGKGSRKGGSDCSMEDELETTTPRSVGIFNIQGAFYCGKK